MRNRPNASAKFVNHGYRLMEERFNCVIQLLSWNMTFTCLGIGVKFIVGAIVEFECLPKAGPLLISDNLRHFAGVFRACQSGSNAAEGRVYPWPRIGCLCCLVAVWLIFATSGFAKTVQDSKTGAAPVNVDEKSLTARQKKMADDYKLLEGKLLALYEIEKRANPERSQLLQRAFLNSQKMGTATALQTIVEQLGKSEFKNAEAQQKAVIEHLTVLLELLQNEDASQRMRDSVRRHLEYLKEIERLQRVQRSLQGQAESTDSIPDLASSQDSIADRTRKLDDEIRSNEQGNQPIANAESAEAPAEPSSGKAPPDPAENKPPKDPAERPLKRGEDNSPGKSQGQEQSEGQATPPAGDGQPQPGDSLPDNPIRERIQAAESRMREAAKKLKAAEREQAMEEMIKAGQELAAAKRELEEILRQMREEEREHILVMLEERFRAMLERQLKVNDQTQRLDKTAEGDRLTDFEIACRKTSVDQKEIMTDVDRALLLLREDGSSVAMPETVAQVGADMAQVSQRLATYRTGTVTQEIENDIAETLGFFISALEQAQKDLDEERKNQRQPPGAAGSAGEQPLVNSLAEIKLIRSLQQRVHKRHGRYAELLENPIDPIGRAEKRDLREAILRLGEQQRRLVDVAREIELQARGKESP